MIQVTRADGKPVPRDVEVALAAVDEGLLELAPNDSWKLLDAMMQRRGIEVDTATAAMQVVGKRHYGRKAREPGGGGGRRTTRELFDTLLFWKARVKLDAQGDAQPSKCRSTTRLLRFALWRWPTRSPACSAPGRLRFALRRM